MTVDPASWAEPAATVVTAAAIMVAAGIWLRMRTWRPTMPVLLELLLAAGLLRLSADDNWRVIATAAAIVCIRSLVKTSVGNSDSAGATPQGSQIPGRPRRSAAATTAGHGMEMFATPKYVEPPDSRGPPY